MSDLREHLVNHLSVASTRVGELTHLTTAELVGRVEDGRYQPATAAGESVTGGLHPGRHIPKLSCFGPQAHATCSKNCAVLWLGVAPSVGEVGYNLRVVHEFARLDVGGLALGLHDTTCTSSISGPASELSVKSPSFRSSSRRLLRVMHPAPVENFGRVAVGGQHRVNLGLRRVPVECQ